MDFRVTGNCDTEIITVVLANQPNKLDGVSEAAFRWLPPLVTDRRVTTEREDIPDTSFSGIREDTPEIRFREMAREMEEDIQSLCLWNNREGSCEKIDLLRSVSSGGNQLHLVSLFCLHTLPAPVSFSVSVVISACRVHICYFRLSLCSTLISSQRLPVYISRPSQTRIHLSLLPLLFFAVRPTPLPQWAPQPSSVYKQVYTLVYL